MKQVRLVLGAAATAALLAAGSASAQTSGDVVTLKSFDGFTQLRGELMEFDGSVYKIATRLGTLEVAADQVECEGEACPRNALFGAAFGIHGSSTIGAALMPALIEGYAESLNASVVRELGTEESERVFRILSADEEEMAAIDLQSKGSGTAYAALADGTAAIGMSSRQATEAEVATLGAADIPDPRDTDRESVVALDGLLIITHPDNPLRSISILETAQIFSGQITNWSELGGPDLPISVYTIDDSSGQSGTVDSFVDLVMAPTGLSLSGDTTTLASNSQVSDTVAGDPAGIGFVSYAFSRAAKALPIRQECGLLAHPTSFNIKSEEYPLSRRLYLYSTDRDEPQHVANLQSFALSDAASPYIEEAGFISLQPEYQTIREQGLRLSHAIVAEDEFSLSAMREMLSQFQDAERISTTFRFTPGSSQLTAKSQREAEFFAREIIDGRYDGREIMLVGFTDSIGQFELNQALATRRAQGVLFTMNEAVIDAADTGDFGGADIQVLGYGELTPVGCNNTFGGRVANRRVEVWVR